MKIRAIAAASEHSNTVGTLEIECCPEGLKLTYVDAARVSATGATVPFARNQQVLVNWTYVHYARPLGTATLLEFKLPSAGTQKCLLVRFSLGKELTLQHVQQRRWLLRLWIIGICVLVASAVALAAPRISPGMAPLMSIGVALFFALLLLAVGFTAETWLSDGGRQSQALAQAFIGDLLSFLPELPRDPVSVPPKPFRWPRFEGILPRTTLAISLTLAGALLASIMTFRSIVAPPQATEENMPVRVEQTPEPDPMVAKAPATSSTPTMAATEAAATVPSTATLPAPTASAGAAGSARITGPCDCQRADSLLWSEPIPRLSLVVLSSRLYRRKEHDRVSVDFAAINNSNQDISELTSMVEFFEQDPPPSSKLVSVSTRAVYYEGPLHPGDAVKWHVDAQGTTFRIHPPAEAGKLVSGALDAHGDNAAPTNAIARLLKANNRPVRLHGAMLLAYLHDPRARNATMELGDGLRESESSYLRRLLEALSEVRTCQVQVSLSGQHCRVIACVHNSTDQPRTPVQVLVRALDGSVSLADPVGAPPQILGEAAATIPGGIAPKSGVLAQIDVDFPSLTSTPAAYEAIAQVAAQQ